jgi:serine/threonine protein kinase/DNA-binding response OmpR family regulator
MSVILVAEQDASYAERIADALRTEGWTVEAVGSRAAALERAAAVRPRLLLANANLPESRALLGAFSRAQGGPGAVVLVPVGRVHEVSAADYRADELLAKPFSDDDLKRTVRSYLERHRAPAPPAATSATAETAGAGETDSQQLTSADIFGDVLAEVEAEARRAKGKRRREAKGGTDDELERKLEETLSGVIPSSGKRRRPAPTGAAKPAARGPAKKARRRPAAEDDIDQLLDKTLSSLVDLPRRPKKPPAPPPARTPAPTAPPTPAVAASPTPPPPAAAAEPTPASGPPASGPPASGQPASGPPASGPPASGPPEPRAEELPEVTFEPLPDLPLPAGSVGGPPPLGGAALGEAGTERPEAEEPPSAAPEIEAPALEPPSLEEVAPTPSAAEPRSEPSFEEIFGTALGDAAGEKPRRAAAADEPESIDFGFGTESFDREDAGPAGGESARSFLESPALEELGAGDFSTRMLPTVVGSEEPAEEEKQEPVSERQTFGDYTLLERIAVGGMAEVWRARRRGVEGFQKTVAIKKILSHLTDSPDFVTMFIDEAKLAAQLTHNHIIQIYDLGKVGEDFFIAMELVDGKDLRSILNTAKKRGKPMPLGLSLLIASALARALDYAHRKRDFDDRELGLVHRDVSPQNVLIGYEGEIKLCDFGIVKAVSKASTTQMGALKGKLQYMSPEQAWGRPVDARSDIFSLGSVLFELLTGERLFTGDSEIGVLDAVRECRIRSPREIDPEIPEEVERIVLKVLAKRPEDRYPTAGEMEHDLKEALDAVQPTPGQKDLGAYLASLFEPGGERASESSEKAARTGTEKVVAAPEAAAAPAPDAGRATGKVADRGASPRKKGRKGRRLLIAAAIAALLLGGGAAAFFLLAGGGVVGPAPETASPPATAAPSPSAPAPAAAGGAAVETPVADPAVTAAGEAADDPTRPAPSPIEESQADGSGATAEPAVEGAEDADDIEQLITEEMSRRRQELQQQLEREFQERRRQLEEEMATVEESGSPEEGDGGPSAEEDAGTGEEEGGGRR